MTSNTTHRKCANWEINLKKHISKQYEQKIMTYKAIRQILKISSHYFRMTA